jgi:hypothetical protein
MCRAGHGMLSRDDVAIIVVVLATSRMGVVAFATSRPWFRRRWISLKSLVIVWVGGAEGAENSLVVVG